MYPVYLSYERVLSDHLVLAIAPSFTWADHGTYSSLLAILWVELDWHPFQNGLSGLFIGPAFAVSYSSDQDFRATGEGLGLSLGYQFLLPWNIDVDIALGLAYGPLQSNDPLDESTEIIPRAALFVASVFDGLPYCLHGAGIVTSLHVAHPHPVHRTFPPSPEA